MRNSRLVCHLGTFLPIHLVSERAVQSLATVQVVNGLYEVLEAVERGRLLLPLPCREDLLLLQVDRVVDGWEEVAHIFTLGL